MKPLTLAKVEMRKLIPYRAFWVYICAFTILFFLSTRFATDLTSGFHINDSPIDLSRFTTFPLIWKSFSWFAGWYFYLLSLLVALVVTNEFENRTIRQHIIDGLSRTDVVSAKVGVAIAFSVYACGLVAFFAFLFGKTSPAYGYLAGSEALVGLLLRGVGHLSFVVLVAFLTRRAVATIIISLSYPIIVEPLTGFTIDQIYDTKIGSYLPFDVFASLTKAPVSAADFGMKVEHISNPSLWALGYIAVFTLLAWLRVRTMDI